MSKSLSYYGSSSQLSKHEDLLKEGLDQVKYEICQRLSEEDSKKVIINEDAIDAVLEAMNVIIASKQNSIGVYDANEQLKKCAKRIHDNRGLAHNILVSQTNAAFTVLGGGITFFVVQNYYKAFLDIIAKLGNFDNIAKMMTLAGFDSAALDGEIIECMKESIDEVTRNIFTTEILNPFRKQRKPLLLTQAEATEQFRQLLTDAVNRKKVNIMKKVSDRIEQATDSAVQKGQNAIADILKKGYDILNFNSASSASSIEYSGSSVLNIVRTTADNNAEKIVSTVSVVAAGTKQAITDSSFEYVKNLISWAGGKVVSVGEKVVSVAAPNLDPARQIANLEREVERNINKVAQTAGEAYADIAHHIKDANQLISNSSRLIVFLLLALTLIFACKYIYEKMINKRPKFREVASEFSNYSLRSKRVKKSAKKSPSTKVKKSPSTKVKKSRTKKVKKSPSTKVKKSRVKKVKKSLQRK